MKTSFLHETFQLQHCETTFLLPDIPGVLLKTSCTLISVYVEYVAKEWSTLTQVLRSRLGIMLKLALLHFKFLFCCEAFCIH